jgi:hypothetical protein
VCKRVSQRAQVFFYHVGFETIVARWNRCVGRKNGSPCDTANGRFEVFAVSLHPVARRFQTGECAMPFVEVIHSGTDSQCRQRANSTHPATNS